MRRTHTTSGRGAASRIGLPLLGSAAGHVVLLWALLLLGAATGPRGGEAIQVLLVEGAALARAGAGEPVPASAGGAARVAAVGTGETKAPQGRPSPAAPPPAVAPSAEVPPVPRPAAPPAAASPAFPPVAPPLARTGEAGAPVGSGTADAPVKAGEGAAAAGAEAAPAPGREAARRAPGPGDAKGPVRGVHVRAAGDGAAGGAEPGSLGVLRARIQERIVYPEEAVRRGQEGEVLLRIRIGRGGIPREVRIARSSGAWMLDDAARRGVVRASPLPTRPGWVEVPVRFFLR